MPGRGATGGIWPVRGGVGRDVLSAAPEREMRMRTVLVRVGMCVNEIENAR